MPRHLPTRQPELGALLNAAASGLSTLGDRVLKPLKVTSAQWKVLVVLARQGPARVSELVTRLQHDQAATSRLVTRMEAAGLVRRADDPNDARGAVIELTARGQQAWRACDARLKTVMADLERQTGATKSRTLHEHLARFAEAVSQALRAPAPRARKRS